MTNQQLYTLHDDGTVTYSAKALAWFAGAYGDTEWAMHVIGPDDVYTTEGGAPDGPALTKDSALRDVANHNRWIAQQIAADPADEIWPLCRAVALHRGVPHQPPQQVPGQLELTETGGAR